VIEQPTQPRVPVLPPDKAIEMAGGKFHQLRPLMERVGKQEDLTPAELREVNRQILDTLAVLLLLNVSLLNAHVTRVVPASGLSLVRG